MLTPSLTASRIIICIAVVPWLAAVYYKTRSLLHMLQLESYQGKRYLNWALTHRNRLASKLELIVWLLLVIGVAVSHYYAQPLGFYLFLPLWLGGQFFLLYKRDKTPAKKPLIFTPRTIRLITIFSLVLICQLVALWWWFKSYQLLVGLLFFLGLILLALITPLNILIANLLATPLETTINWGYFKSAKGKLKRLSDLTVIAITGSYGKTSTKYILGSLLSPYYPTLMTPESYNTPMGICKVIRQELTDEHKYFIVEMGARKSGDIAELCRLVRPKIGVITAIGPQHLETFGSLDNIIRTKAELIAGLGQKGLVVLNADDPHCRQLSSQTRISSRLYGIESNHRLDLKAEGIKTDNQGIRFTVYAARGGEIELAARLLGKHNVYNVLAAATIALECNLSLAQIAQALKQVQPAPHRLQLIHGSGGATIIDDAYNSNPEGAKEALQVLASLNGGKKILITPGMIELGAEEYKQNKQLGWAAAGVCDTVILVGPKRTRPIAEGLGEAGFPAKNLLVVGSLNEATTHLHKLIKPGDVALFENDLPDNYNE